MRNLVLSPDGTLSAEVVSYEQVELAQLEAEVNAKQEAVDQAQSAVADAQVLFDEAQAKLSEAQAALDESKSEFTRGQELVGQPRNDDGSVPVDVTVANQDPQL